LISTKGTLEVHAGRFGFDSFRPGQEQVVEALLAGRSVLAVFPTGAGKSLCYQLPALLLDGVTVVVSPLIALMKDQVDFMAAQGVEAARLDSSLGLDEARGVSDRLRAGSLRLLYVAPDYAAFDGPRTEFLRRVVASGKTGRVWTTLDPDEAARTLGEERSRIVAALGHLEERELVELKAADARQRFTLIRRPESVSDVCDRLAERSERREQAEVDRIGRVVLLVTHDGCQVNALVGYFGEQRDEPCGHCSFCLGGEAQSLPEATPPSDLESLVDEPAFEALQAAHPGALGAARQRARFLCGLSSPATSRAKLTRGPLYGVLAECRFADVLGWSEARAAGQV
jgi:hypothetical protein